MEGYPSFHNEDNPRRGCDQIDQELWNFAYEVHFNSDELFLLQDSWEQFWSRLSSALKAQFSPSTRLADISSCLDPEYQVAGSMANLTHLPESDLDQIVVLNRRSPIHWSDRFKQFFFLAPEIPVDVILPHLSKAVKEGMNSVVSARETTKWPFHLKSSCTEGKLLYTFECGPYQWDVLFALRDDLGINQMLSTLERASDNREATRRINKYSEAHKGFREVIKCLKLLRLDWNRSHPPGYDLKGSLFETLPLQVAQHKGKTWWNQTRTLNQCGTRFSEILRLCFQYFKYCLLHGTWIPPPNDSTVDLLGRRNDVQLVEELNQWLNQFTQLCQKDETWLLTHLQQLKATISQVEFGDKSEKAFSRFPPEKEVPSDFSSLPLKSHSKTDQIHSLESSTQHGALVKSVMFDKPKVSETTRFSRKNEASSHPTSSPFKMEDNHQMLSTTRDSHLFPFGRLFQRTDLEPILLQIGECETKRERGKWYVYFQETDDALVKDESDQGKNNDGREENVEGKEPFSPEKNPPSPTIVPEPPMMRGKTVHFEDDMKFTRIHLHFLTQEKRGKEEKESSQALPALMVDSPGPGVYCIWHTDHRMHLTYALEEKSFQDGGKEDELPTLRRRIKYAANVWNHVCGVRFSETNDNNPLFLVHYNPNREQQVIARAFFPYGDGKLEIFPQFFDTETIRWKGYLLHELGHVLGFPHEHIADPAYVEAMLAVGQPRPKGIARSVTGSLDPQSIMHYNILKNPELRLSEQDKIGAKLLYGDSFSNQYEPQ